MCYLDFFFFPPSEGKFKIFRMDDLLILGATGEIPINW